MVSEDEDDSFPLSTFNHTQPARGGSPVRMAAPCSLVEEQFPLGNTFAVEDCCSSALTESRWNWTTRTPFHETAFSGSPDKPVWPRTVPHS